jgi:hypothetical protein
VKRMCNCVKTKSVAAGWGCCMCRCYSGMQRRECRNCGRSRCKPLSPDKQTGEWFESYEEAYANDPDMLARVNEQLQGKG